MHEWPTSLGIPTVTSSHKPCPFCSAKKGTMYAKYYACSLEALPWEETDDTSHEVECCKREIVVNVNTDDIRRLILDIGKPYYPKSKKGRGRALSCAIPELGLLPNDRIEPH
eukprot:59092-Pyramimonas_sp.AAC.2